ncbi:T-complex 11 [Blyttiomyces helicus]|uniref:T-complex 11 n=1 Tax=Blyttiomyces helicus TaxID=388810 RepID=A0A4P9WI38_9FUNG|nr:T-complex 11 [Blyttiomyces helicus]|eukprot:RKO91645.1 T-complex 11 [Blyttiomyces helicus]
MDPDFTLKAPEPSPLEVQVRAMAKKAFFDGVREDMARGNYSRIVGLIGDIKLQLLSMVSEKGKIARDIAEVLDVEHIEQQLQRNAFDTIRCVSYIVRQMLSLCAPIRDAAIRSIETLPDLASAFERILDILDDMKMDLANYRLQALRPHLKQQAVDYEKGKFEDALTRGIISLDRTTTWLGASVTSLKAVAAARNPENIDLAENRVKFEDAYNEALLSTIFSTTPVSIDSLPETLIMDAQRIHGFQNEAQAVTIVAALIMLSKNSIPSIRSDRAALVKLKETFYVLLRSEGTTVANLAAHIIAIVPAAALTPEKETMIRTMVDKTLSARDAIFSLLSRRVQAAIRGQLEKGHFKREALVSHGLDLVQVELEKLSRSIALLAKHNKMVHAAHYDGILRQII